MFEGWVYQLVAGYLGNYIKDIHREQFRIGLWSGVALVENAELRLEAFDYLQLPCAIKQGFVGKLRLQIPWKTLFWEPILIALEDVYICACPRDESEFDAEASESRALAAKKAQLAAAEITKLSSHVPDEKVRQSLLSHLLAKFIANIQITVRNVHIRYVDNAEGSFNFGVKLAGLTALDARGGPNVKTKSTLVHKSVEINQFAIYWNSIHVSRPVNTVGHYLTKWFAKKDEDLTYILNPIDISSKLTVNRSAASEGSGAQFALAVSMDKLDFNIGSRQLYEMFLLWESMKVSQLRERYGRFRPQICPSEVPHWQRSWWQYAINAVSSDVQKRLRRTSWNYLAWRLDCRRRYVALYKAKLEAFQDGQPPDAGVVTDLEELEKELDMEMILSFRSFAEEKWGFYLDSSEVIDPIKKAEDNVADTSRRSRGWLSLFSFGMLGGSGTMDTAAEFTGPLSDEIMKDLYAATNFHPAPLPNGDWSKGYSLLAMSLQLRQAVARMENTETKHGLIEATFHGIYAGFRKLHNLASAAVVVKSFNVVDICTENTCFQDVVTSKAFKSSRYASSKHKSYAEAVYGANAPNLFEIGISQRELSEAAFCLDIELSDDPGLKVVIVLKPLEIIYSPLLISGLLNFFKLPILRELDEIPKNLTKPSHSSAWTKLLLTVDLRHPVLLIPACCSAADSAILAVSTESLHLELSEVHGLVDYSDNSNGTISNVWKTVKLFDIPSSATALEHFELKLTGLQVGMSEGSNAATFNSNVVNPFNIQLHIVKYRDLFATHWKADGASDAINVLVSTEKCTALKDVFRTVASSFEQQLSDEEGDYTLIPPQYVSPVLIPLILAHYNVASLSIQISLPEEPSGALNAASINLSHVELKISTGLTQKEATVSMAALTIENMDVSNDSSQRFLLNKTASLTCAYLETWRAQEPVQQFHLHLQNAEFNVYPRICGALAAFLATFRDQHRASPTVAGIRKASFSLTTQLKNVSFQLHESYGALAKLSLPHSSFLFESTFENWELEGTATDLRITGPDFATQKIKGIPFGNMLSGPPCSLQLRLVKQVVAACETFDLLVCLEAVECILQSDYVALLIGFFTSPDWAQSPGTGGQNGIAEHTVVFQYKVEVRKSLLLLPIGGGSFVAIPIPEFKFAFIPAELGEVSGLDTNCKRFYITGKQLALSNYGLSCEVNEQRCCLPLIDRLDGEISIDVPLSETTTTVGLRFSVAEVTLIGEVFLEQIHWVEVISNDLALIGQKALHASKIWECLNSGNRFLLDTGGQKGKPSLQLKCCVDKFGVQLLSRDGLCTVETITAGQARFINSCCTIRLGLLDHFTMKLASIIFVDGGSSENSNGSLDIELNRNPSFDAVLEDDQPLATRGRCMVSVESDTLGITVDVAPSPAAKKVVAAVLPRAEIWLHFASWSKIFSWIFIAFPVLAEPPLQDCTVQDGSDSALELRIGIVCPYVVFVLPESTQRWQNQTRTICFTSALHIDELELTEDYRCNFSARLSQMKAKTKDGRAPGNDCLSSGNVDIKGNLELSSQIVLSLFLTVSSVDFWCSYPVFQFLNAFEMDSSRGEVSADMDVVVNVTAAVQTASLLLTDGRWNYNCPLLELVIGDSFGELSWSSSTLQLSLASVVEISYHDIQKAVWEPFLEPWTVSLGISRQPVPTATTLTTKMDVKSSDNLNINITEGVCQAVKRAIEMITWSKELEADPHNSRMSFSQYAPYWFQNDTGTAVSYALIWPYWNEEASYHSDHFGTSSWRQVLPGCSVPLFVDENEDSNQRRRARWKTPERKKFGLTSHRRMCVRLEGTAAASLPMSIDLVGSRNFEVVFSKFETSRDAENQDQNNFFSTHVLFEVSLQHHSKLIRLYSTVSLANTTSVILEARLEIPFGIAPKVMDSILPGQVIALPVHLAETGRIRIRPHGEGFLWSEAQSLSKLISPEYKQCAQRPVVCYPARPSDAPFRCCISIEEKPVSAAAIASGNPQNNRGGWMKWTILLRAPFVITNCLQCGIEAEVEGGSGLNVRTSVAKGDSVFVYEVDVVNDLNLKIIMPQFLPSSIKFGRVNSRDKAEISETLVLNTENPSGRPVCTRVDKTINLTSGRRELWISAPYWLYNCSGLDLAFMDGDVDLYVEGEQVLCDVYSTSTTSQDHQGLHCLLNSSSEENSFHRRAGKLASHLPSCSVFRPALPATLSPASSTETVPEDASLPPAYLYSPAQGSEVSEHKMRLRILHSTDSVPVSWTQPFFLDPPGGTSSIIIPQPDSKGAYVLSVCTLPAMGACSGRTKTITFRPRFVLANASQQDICFKQQGTDIVQHLPVGQIVHVHWTDATRALLLSVKYNQHGWEWSGGFAPDRLGDTQVKVHNHFSGTKEILRVEVSNPDAEGTNISSGNERLGTFFIIVTNDETGFMPFRIDNFSMERLRFYQKSCEKTENIVQPYSSCDYAWDEPCLPPQLVIEVPGQGSLGTYELECVKSYPPVLAGQKSERRLVVSVHAEGAKRVLSVVDLAMHTQKDPKKFQMGRNLIESPQAVLEEFSINLSCIGISLVDSTPQELLFGSASGVKIQFLQSEREQDLKLEITHLQVDNQLRHTTYPVLLTTLGASSKHSERAHSELATVERPEVSLIVSKWRHPTGSVDCYQCIYLSIAPLRLELEERNLIWLIGFFRSLGSNMGSERSTNFQVQPLNDDLSAGNVTNLRFVEMAEASEVHKSWPAPAAMEALKFPTRRLIVSAKQKRKAYIEAFCIDMLELTVSFSSIPWLPKEARGVAAESILWMTGSLLQRRLIALADVEGAPIRLRQLILAHPMANWNSVLGIIQRHYTRQLLHEVYKVLGSADVFGNPMSFMQSLGSGMWDFVSAPARSIGQNPVHVVQGVRLGTKSLFRNTIFAFSNAATQMSKAARKGMAALALDQEYLGDHEARHHGPWSPDSSIVNEFLEGLTGLLQSSVRGAERHGIPGVFSGVALGVLRAIARPAASILEVAGKTAQSIRNSSRPTQLRITRVRLPRHLEPDFPLLPYSWQEALAMDVLLEADKGHLKNEVYITCQQLSEPGVFVLLTESLLLQVKATGREDLEAEWSITFKSNIEDILYINRHGEQLEVLFCAPNAFQAGQQQQQQQQQQRMPFSSIALSLLCSEDADELHQALLHVLKRKRSRGM